MVAEEDAREPGRERSEVENGRRRRKGVTEHGSDGKRGRRVARREAVGKDAVTRPRMGKGELEPIRQDPRDDDRQENDQARAERAAVSRDESEDGDHETERRGAHAVAQVIEQGHDPLE